jgi:large subunit ribosomal protein L17
MNSGAKKYRLPRKDKAHREAVIKSQVIELLRAGKIKTTDAKARILKSKIDRLISLAQNGSPSAHQEISSFLPTERAVERLLAIVPKFKDRKSGFTRVIQTTNRVGDGAKQYYVMFVEDLTTEKKSLVRKTLERQAKK